MELESLEIKIQAQAQQASGQIDALVTRLGRLSSALSGLSTGNLNSLATGVNRLASTMTAMRGIDTRTFSAVARNVSKLGAIDSGKINAAAGSMRQISNAVKGLSGMSASVKGLTDLASAIKQLGYQSSTKAIENIPKLATAMRQLMSELSRAPQVSNNLIRMTEALARLARTGGAAGTAARSITKSFDGFSASSSRVKKSSFSLASAIGKVYATYWTLFRAFRLLGDAIDISSSLTEVENVVRQTFGQYESLINNFAKTSIEKFGMSELSAKQFASRFQAMGTALDIPQGKMADMSIRLTELTGDMASFYDVSQEDVAKSLQSVFSGTTAPMRRYGIDLTQATLKEWALKQGLDADVSSMSQAQKAMLRYQYVLAHTTNITGDFKRTQDSWHNQVTLLRENFKALGAVVGSGLINAFKPFLHALNTVLKKVISFAEMVTNALGSIFGWRYEASKGAGVTDDLADSYEDVGDAADDAGEKTKKAAKEAKKATRPFDELKVINEKTSSGSGNSGSGSGGSGSGGSSGGDTGKLVPTDTIFKSNIKDLEGLGESIRDALVKAVGGIEWDKIYAKASGFGTGLAEFLNGLFSEDKKGNSVFTATADVIAGALNTAIFASKGFTDKFDFETLGNNIAHGFNRFFKKFKWKQCAEAINGWVDGFWKFVRGFFDDLSWEDIFNGLKTFLKNLTPESLATILMFSSGKLAPIVSSALCSILGFTNGGKGGKGGKTFNLNGLGLAMFIGTIAYQLTNKKFDFTSAVVEALAAGGAAFYMSNGNPYFALAGVTVSVGISLGKFFVEKSDKMKKGIKKAKESVDLEIGKIFGGKKKVQGFDGKKTLITPASELGKGKVKDNAYSGTSSSKLAKNQDWYNKQRNTKKITKNHAVAGFSENMDRLSKTADRNYKLKVKAEITSAEDKISKKKKKLDNYTASISKGKDGIKKNGKTLENFNANISKKTDKLKLSEKSIEEFEAKISRKSDNLSKNDKFLYDFNAVLSKNKDNIKSSDKSLKNYTANLYKNKDGIPSKDKSLKNYIANLSDNKDKIPLGYKLLNNYTAKLVENKDKIKSSDKKLDNYTGKLTKAQDNIRPADKKIGGFTAKITSFVNDIKNKFLNFAARLTGKSTKKADGGVFSGGSWKPIKKYAVGGLPNMGQMFVAREAGPELVGTLGGHTAVMNNDQIVSSVSVGVAQAVKEVIQPLVKTSVGNNRPIQISLDGKVIFDSTRQSAQEYFNRTGMSPFPV